MTNISSNKKIATTWLTGQSSCTMVIPRDFAVDLGLDKPSNVTVTKEGKRLIVEKLDI
jgi:hypothetical protein